MGQCSAPHRYKTFTRGGRYTMLWCRPPPSDASAPSIEDTFLSCSEPKRNVVEPSLVSVGTAKMIHCRRRCWWWCVHDLRLKIIMHRCDVWTCMSAANACWIVLCKCMLDIKCSVLRGWSCAITKSFEFWLRTVEKMGLILMHHRRPRYA